MMRPTLRSAYLLMAGIPLAVLPTVAGDRWWLPWLVVLALSLTLMGVDALLTRPGRRSQLAVTAPHALFIGAPGALAAGIRLFSRPPPAVVEALCDLDPLLDPLPVQRLSGAGGSYDLRLPLVARRRGRARIRTLWLRWTGPLGLMERREAHALDLALPVLPNVPAVQQAALRFFGSRELMAGHKLERYAGDGSEFERLREFVPGLDQRAMDWKASARHRRLLSREFRAERNHQVIIAFDTGHLLCEPINGVPKLDHAITAGLLLTYFSLRAGDRVGLFGFDSHTRLYLAPQAGIGSFSRLQLATADLAYSEEETNFTLGLADLSTRLRRRSLVVLLTDFVDAVTARLMVDNVQALARRHLVLFVTLRNPETGAIAAAPPATMGSMARSVVATSFLREREAVLRQLGRYGIQTIDAEPGQVSTRLLNHYLDIKRREMIA